MVLRLLFFVFFFGSRVATQSNSPKPLSRARFLVSRRIAALYGARLCVHDVSNYALSHNPHSSSGGGGGAANASASSASAASRGAARGGGRKSPKKSAGAPGTRTAITVRTAAVISSGYADRSLCHMSSLPGNKGKTGAGGGADDDGGGADGDDDDAGDALLGAGTSGAAERCLADVKTKILGQLLLVVVTTGAAERCLARDRGSRSAGARSC